MLTLPDAGRRPAAFSVLALAAAAWLLVPSRLLMSGSELDLGLTVDNLVFVIENAAMSGTVVLGVGAVALRARRLLTGAIVVAGVHLLLQLVTAAVQLVNGARPDLVLGTLVAIFVLAVVLAGAVLARLLRNPASARRTGLVIALVGAIVHTLWTNMALPLVSSLPYGGPPPGMVESLLLILLLNLLVVATAALCGWAGRIVRRIGAVLATVAGLFGILAVSGATALGVPYTALQALEPVLMFAAAAAASVAGWRLASRGTPAAVRARMT